MSNRDLNAAPSGCYPCRGKGNWIAIATYSEEQWRSLVCLIDVGELDRFSTLGSRMEHQDELDTLIASWTAAEDKHELARLCQQAGVPAAAVLNVREVMTNEHLLLRAAFEVVQSPPPPDGVDNRLHLAPPWKLARTPATTLRQAPLAHGQHNAYVYRQLLGMSDEELSGLIKKGVIADTMAADRTIWVSADQFPVRDDDYLSQLGLTL